MQGMDLCPLNKLFDLLIFNILNLSKFLTSSIIKILFFFDVNFLKCSSLVQIKQNFGEN
jgi:hypothetical protein